MDCDAKYSVCEGQGNWVLDPYALELRGSEEWVVLCRNCYHEIAMDI